MSENEFDREQFDREKREWVLKMLDRFYRASPDRVIEWVNTVWPHSLGVTKETAYFPRDF